MKDKIKSSSIGGSSSGFTLIELLVVIAVAAILLSIAVPSYSNFVNQQRVETAANAFKNAVALARSEAQKRGKNASIRPIDQTSNAVAGPLAGGWHTYYVPQGNVRTTVATHRLESGSIKVTANGSYFYFSGKTGRLATQWGTEKTICFSDFNNSSNITKYVVTINQAGSADVKKSAVCPV